VFGLLAFVGMMTFDNLGDALIAPAVYAGTTLLEGNFLTPMLLSHRLRINAVCVFVGLMAFAFLWGVPGLLLAVPILAMTRIICDHVTPLMPIGRFLGDGRGPPADSAHNGAAQHG
jgi:predicted PurR-regulated permease PerM